MPLQELLSLIQCSALHIAFALLSGGCLALILWLRSRYGGRWLTLTLIAALLCGIAGARVAQVTYEPPAYAYNEEQVYPAEKWRKILTLSETPTSLEYRQSEGVFVITKQADIQITGVFPMCLVDGELSKYQGISSPPIEVTSSPRIQLPPPPIPPLYQTTLDIPVQLDDTDILGASSFAVYADGEVWCSERFLMRGQGVGVAVALRESLEVLFRIIRAFCGGFATMFVVAMILLEIRHRHHL
jgi:hypothetical protein